MKFRFCLLGWLTGLWVLLLGSTLAAQATESSLEALDFAVSSERQSRVEEEVSDSPNRIALPVADGQSRGNPRSADESPGSVGLLFEVGAAPAARSVTTAPRAEASVSAESSETAANLSLEEYRGGDRTAATVTRLRRAIVGQESGGQFDRVNPHSGALGYAQLMPTNVTAWGKEALGYAPSKQAFLGDPQLQLKVIDYKLAQYWRQELRKAGGDEATAVMRVASRWYSGNPELYTSSRTQFYRAPNGRSYRYPSISAYSWSVLRRFQSLAENNAG